jgi:hypothetical protein
MGLIVLTMQFGTPQLLGFQRHAVVPLSITIAELVRVHYQGEGHPDASEIQVAVGMPNYTVDTIRSINEERNSIHLYLQTSNYSCLHDL